MTELGPDARAIIEAARHADAPRPADRARVKRSVALRVTAAGAAGAVGAGTAVAATLSGGAKVALLVLGVSVAAGGAGVWTWRAQGRTGGASTRPVAVAVPEPSGGGVGEASRSSTADGRVSPRALQGAAADMRGGSTPGAASREVVRSRTRRVASAVPSSTEPSGPDPLDAEVALLGRARNELRAGLPAQALKTLQEHARRFAGGALDQERRAMTAIARCQAEPGAESAAEARAFLQTSPRSPLAGRVRAACVSFDDGARPPRALNRSRPFQETDDEQ